MAGPPPLMRMMPSGVPPSSAAPLVVYGGRQPPVPRPTMAPLPLAAAPVRAAAFNVPPPARQIPRTFIICYLYISCYVLELLIPGKFISREGNKFPGNRSGLNRFRSYRLPTVTQIRSRCCYVIIIRRLRRTWSVCSLPANSTVVSSPPLPSHKPKHVCGWPPGWDMGVLMVGAFDW